MQAIAVVKMQLTINGVAYVFVMAGLLLSIVFFVVVYMMVGTITHIMVLNPGKTKKIYFLQPICKLAMNNIGVASYNE